MLAAHLDTLLAWLAQPDGEAARPLSQAIAATGLTGDQAAKRAYAVLDAMLLAADPNAAPERLLGLEPRAGQTAIKQRYRRLISAYHPDRHPGREKQLTPRLERINLAYRALERRTAGPPRTLRAPTRCGGSSDEAPRPGRRHPPLGRGPIWAQARARTRAPPPGRAGARRRACSAV